MTYSRKNTIKKEQRHIIKENLETKPHKKIKDYNRSASRQEIIRAMKEDYILYDI